MIHLSFQCPCPSAFCLTDTIFFFLSHFFFVYFFFPCVIFYIFLFLIYGFILLLLPSVLSSPLLFIFLFVSFHPFSFVFSNLSAFFPFLFLYLCFHLSCTFFFSPSIFSNANYKKYFQEFDTTLHLTCCLYTSFSSPKIKLNICYRCTRLYLLVSLICKWNW